MRGFIELRTEEMILNIFLRKEFVLISINRYRAKHIKNNKHITYQLVPYRRLFTLYEIKGRVRGNR